MRRLDYLNALKFANSAKVIHLFLSECVSLSILQAKSKLAGVEYRMLKQLNVLYIQKIQMIH